MPTAAEIVYASPAFTDGDQDVVLLNMQLSHFVEFYPHFDGPRPDGMKGMVESNYGKRYGYKEAPWHLETRSHCGIGKFRD